MEFLPSDYVRNLFQAKFLAIFKIQLTNIVNAMFKLNITVEHKKNLVCLFIYLLIFY